MAYTPTTWVTGDTVTATKMNKLEQGVANAGGATFFNITEEDGVLNKTWTEILTAVSNGQIARIYASGEDFAYCPYVFLVNTDEEFWYVHVTDGDRRYQAASASGYPELAD